MREVLNDIDLLDFIEDGLTPPRAAALRAQLANQPEVLARLERMKGDRAMLAADVEPMLAADLVAELEPLLAKPMLLGASPLKQVRPGVYRAKHRRSFARRWQPLAMAAGILLTAGTAIALLIVEFGPWQGRSNADRLASTGSDDDGSGQDPDSADRRIEMADGGSSVIHHWLPAADLLNSALAMELPAGGAGAIDPALRITLRSGAEAIESPVALVLSRDRADEVMQRLASMIEEHRATAGGDLYVAGAALVRNFTYAEVESAWRDMVASSGLPRQDQLIASMNGRPGTVGFTAQQKETVHRVARHSTIELGERLAGDPALAATAEQQLRFGDFGAAHAITLSAHEVIDLLESLSTEFGAAIQLAPLGAMTAEDDPSGDDPLREWRQWREAIEAIAGIQHESKQIDGLIVVPIRFN